MPPSDVAHDSLVGNTLGGYEVQALIGRGAMGTVYLARDRGLNRNVALKVLLGSLASDPDRVRRFHREAQTAAPLRHPSIVQIYSAGTERDTPYIAMEFIEGEPLDRFLRRHGKVPWQTALYIGRQVVEALECAHAKGVIHRDVKPANILLDKHGRARLTDFGIANVAALDRGAAESGEYIGTPHYMSPEQCAGREVGPASDLYSLGVTLYRLIAGRMPFKDDSPVALIKSITNDEPPRLNRVLHDVPDDVARLVAHLMSKRPKERPANAQWVCKTIERLQAEKGGHSAMPEALRAFMREHTRIRPVRTIIKPGGPSDLDLPERIRRPPLPLRAVMGRLVGVLGSLAVFTCLPILAELLSAPPAPPARPPTPEGVVFTEMPPQTRVARFEAEDFRFESVWWIGHTSAVLVKVAGRDGTLSHQAAGLLALDVKSRQCLSVLSPASPMMVPDCWDLRPTLYGEPGPSYSAPGTPLHEAVVLPVFEARPRAGERYVDIVARKWNGGPTQQRVVFRMRESRWNPNMRSPWSGETTQGRVVPNPDGVNICVVMNDPVTGMNYLVERDVRAEELTSVRPRITTGDAWVRPSSVRYSPSGNQLAYVRETEAGQRELWVYSFGRDEVNGRPVGVGVADDHVSFGPNESLLAVQVKREGRAPELRLLSAVNGMVVAPLGPGAFGSQPWHPSGEWVAATELGRLWAIETAAPYRRKPLSPADLYLTGGGAVSHDGSWVASIVEAEGESAVVFVSVEAVSFTPSA